jgi:hypothetical protein
MFSILSYDLQNESSHAKIIKFLGFPARLRHWNSTSQPVGRKGQGRLRDANVSRRAHGGDKIAA